MAVADPDIGPTGAVVVVSCEAWSCFKYTSVTCEPVDDLAAAGGGDDGAMVADVVVGGVVV